jgi:hypothetical protein
MVEKKSRRIGYLNTLKTSSPDDWDVMVRSAKKLGARLVLCPKEAHILTVAKITANYQLDMAYVFLKSKEYRELKLDAGLVRVLQKLSANTSSNPRTVQNTVPLITQYVKEGSLDENALNEYQSKYEVGK